MPSTVTKIKNQEKVSVLEIMKDQMIIDRIILDENYNEPTTHNTISNEIVFSPDDKHLSIWNIL